MSNSSLLVFKPQSFYFRNAGVLGGGNEVSEVGLKIMHLGGMYKKNIG